MDIVSALENTPARRPQDPIPRGVSPKILLDQIHVTVPYLLNEKFPNENSFGYFWTLKNTRELLQRLGGAVDFDHAQYYRLCLSAHYATVGSFVPTDVDNQIR